MWNGANHHEYDGHCPIVVILSLVQRYFIESSVMSGIK